MAETPFSPESGATSGGTAPEDGNQGSPALASPDLAVAPQVAPADASEPPTAVEGRSIEALPSEPQAAPASSAAPPESAPSEPASEPTSAAPAPAESPVSPPGVAATITVPPLPEGESSGGGGEWDLLVERFTTWWNSGELNRQWQRIRGPLKGVAIVVLVLLALQVYATVVGVVDGIPLVSGLLELTGLIAVLQFSTTRLLRSSDRQEVFTQLQRRWDDFRGRH